MPAPAANLTPQAKAHLAQIIVAYGAEAANKDLAAISEQVRQVKLECGVTFRSQRGTLVLTLKTGLTRDQIGKQLRDNRANVRRQLATFAQSLATNGGGHPNSSSSSSSDPNTRSNVHVKEE
jgi:hypothetical protein